MARAGNRQVFTVGQVLRQTPCKSFSFHALTPLARLIQGLPRGRKLPLWAETLAGKIEAGEEPEGPKVVEVLGALLAELAPVVLYLEDIHELGPEIPEWLTALARIAAKQKGVGLLVSSREHPPEGFQAIRLEPLSGEALRAILEAEVSTALPAEALAWLEARAGGNPLFALEFFRFMTRQGFLWNDGQRWRWREPERRGLPVTVEALIEQTLNRVALTETLGKVLRAKAFLPKATNEAALCAVAGVTPEELAAARTARAP